MATEYEKDNANRMLTYAQQQIHRLRTEVEAQEALRQAGQTAKLAALRQERAAEKALGRLQIILNRQEQEVTYWQTVKAKAEGTGGSALAEQQTQPTSDARTEAAESGRSGTAA